MSYTCNFIEIPCYQPFVIIGRYLPIHKVQSIMLKTKSKNLCQHNLHVLTFLFTSNFKQYKSKQAIQNS